MVGLVTVGVTAAYVTRLWLMTFLGEPRSPVAAHESSPAMRWPLVVLAVPSALARARRAAVGLAAGLARSGRRGRLQLLHDGADVAQTELHIGLVTSVLSVGLAVRRGAGHVAGLAAGPGR